MSFNIDDRYIINTKSIEFVEKIDEIIVNHSQKNLVHVIGISINNKYKITNTAITDEEVKHLLDWRDDIFDSIIKVLENV